MAFTFLHTADWQIGKSFSGFDPDRTSLLKHARLTAVDRLAAAARAGGARDVVVCGDVFDSAGLPERLLREVLSRLAAYGDIVWHLLPGNHDPARDDGVWRRLVAIGVPDNVKLLLTAAPQPVGDTAVLLPAPLTARAVSADPTLWMDQAESDRRLIRIGVAHGSTQGFGSAGAAAVGIDPARRATAQLDYLALGDWHGWREVAAGIWYSGTPEPDQFPENTPGHALLVTIEAPGQPPRVTPVATALHTWIKRKVAVRGPLDLQPLIEEMDALGAAKANVLLEVTLAGTVSLASDAAISARLDELAPSLFHLRVRREELKLVDETAAADALRDPQLARIAARLEALRQGDESPEIAEAALRRLYALSRTAEGSSA